MSGVSLAAPLLRGTTGRCIVQVTLEILTSADGTLIGCLHWEEDGDAHQFHGTLELIALLEAAVASMTGSE
jgi:hypothetical protein